MKLGDRLRRSIEMGLAGARYGIIVISPNFLRKEWPQRELDGLYAREVDGKKVILPVWQGVEHADVVEVSPMLADRVAALSNNGVEHVVTKIMHAMDWIPPSDLGPVEEDIFHVALKEAWVSVM